MSVRTNEWYECFNLRVEQHRAFPSEYTLIEIAVNNVAIYDERMRHDLIHGNAALIALEGRFSHHFCGLGVLWGLCLTIICPFVG